MKINKSYTDKEMISQMQDFFMKNGYLRLENAFEENIDKIKSNINKEKFKKIYLPSSCSKEILTNKDTFNLEVLKVIEYFKSKEFREYIEKIIDFDLTLRKIELNR